MQITVHRPVWVIRLDYVVGVICAWAAVLVIPLSLLLFAQWPLRDVVHAYSREANDLAQMLFAIYVSIAITYATRTRSHLAADALAHRFASLAPHRLNALTALAAVLMLGVETCAYSADE
jgi:TRAP-type C4-dicarboxylate transport system permease small subunit